MNPNKFRDDPITPSYLCNPNEDNGVNNGNVFAKDTRDPLPQYHLESSSGQVKYPVTPHQLKSQFGGHKFHNFGLLSQLGTGISLVHDGSDKILTVGELVNWKRSCHKQKGSRAAFPLEIVGRDIEYYDGITGAHGN